ncbi:hypothetical protein Stsp01_33780 [Streptomyces sp. NBRC 13847]|uniref:hypothetical protein n=1 Tax=Streptomyces TaxID=1883 RepID=UPI0024A5937B|nr:hypothetical protein [Streptomyces sp. NBRC 13847]GLW16635.1 hypothetical protein Stsp01_33780 [Streptomyces sp. NBRC 13847]
MTTTPDSGPRPRTSAPAARHRTRFFDHRIPSLYAGRYRIDNQQILRAVDGTDRVIDATPQPFDVVQPRFGLGPGGINARFPVPDAVGTYGQTLPHLNLDAPGLPWSRPLGPGHPGEVPWLALLLFREDELPEDRDAVGTVTAGTVREYLDGGLGPGATPALPPESLRPDEYDEHCATVLVPAALFDAVAPLPVEMGYLAHVREGGPPDATRAGDDPEPDEKELNAIVVANRFPAATGGRHVVHLVSLEGFDRYLTAPAPSAGVRLTSLACWSFTSESDSGTGFGDVCQHLATTDGVTPRPEAELRLRVPVAAPDRPTAPQQEALDRMASGAVALPQRLETGERTVAFHRGPLTARPAAELPGPAATRLESPGEALIYLEKYGVFDTAYAAAFTAGRLLALADDRFRSALMEFRSAARAAVRRLASHPDLAGRVVNPRQLTAPLACEAFDRMLRDGEGSRFARAVDRAGQELRAGHRRPAGTGARRTPAEPRALLAAPGVADVLTRAAPDEFNTVTGWLDRLRRLEMLGLEHLVPDERALPPESIRFAYADPCWIRAAVDGALSIGVGHALDADLNALATTGGPVPACAVLLRSRLVPDWPGTIVTAYADGTPVAPLRTAVHGTDTQLLLYPRLIDRFELAEPPRGICFGIGDVGTVELREISGDHIGYPKGEFPRPAGFGRFLRPGGRDVLNVHGSGDALVPALSAAHGVPRISSAQFALQLINAPQVQTFSRP